MASTSSGATSNDICSKEVVTLSDDDAGPSKVTWSTQLKQIFPEAKKEDLEDAALLSSSMDEAASLIMEKTITEKEKSVFESVENVIDVLIKKNSS